MPARLLKIDLSKGESQVDPIPDSYLRDFIGGSGLGVRLLWDRLDPAVSPLDPVSPLLWVNGPLTGTAGPTTGRSTLCGRSPQTGLWGESNIGGFVGPELRFAGYDAVEITGRAAEPVYLWIHDDRVEIRPAGHLWGQADIYETQRILKDELDEPLARVACIGLAGENGVPFSGIFSDHGRAAARTGLGTLMGSKNLKALAVRGTGKPPLGRPDDYKRLRLAANKALLEENMTSVFRATGTGGSAEYLQMLGDMPQKYWTQASFDETGSISGGTMAETILTGVSACQGCVISCGRVVSVSEGPYAIPGKVKGPEYETWETAAMPWAWIRSAPVIPWRWLIYYSTGA
jgi:aldehyde:ferredoxin oxidoreductase